MWTRRDFAALAAAAVATFGLTLAGFWPRLATAGDEATPTAHVALPKLQFQGCEVYAQVAQSERVVSVQDGSVTFKPGPLPVMQLVVHNDGQTEASVEFDATFTVMSLESMFSRRISVNPPAWTESYFLSLGPGQTRTIDLPTSAKPAAAPAGDDGAWSKSQSVSAVPTTLEPGSMGQLMLSSKTGDARITALSLATERASQGVAQAQSQVASEAVALNR